MACFHSRKFPLFSQFLNFKFLLILLRGTLQGTVLDDFIQSKGQSFTYNLLITIINFLLSVSEYLPNLFNYQLEHWGLEPRRFENILGFAFRAMRSKWYKSSSTAWYDMSVEGTFY